MNLRGIVIRLRMITMNLRHTRGPQIVRKESLSVAHREPKVLQPALVSPSGGVADDYRQHINAEMIVILSPNGAADQKASVAAAKIDNDGSSTPEELRQVKRSVGGKALECRLCPERGIE